MSLRDQLSLREETPLIVSFGSSCLAKMFTPGLSAGTRVFLKNQVLPKKIQSLTKYKFPMLPPPTLSSTCATRTKEKGDP